MAGSSSTGEGEPRNLGPTSVVRPAPPGIVGNAVSSPAGEPEVTDFEFGRNYGQRIQTPDQQGIMGNKARLQQCREGIVYNKNQSPGPQEDYG